MTDKKLYVVTFSMEMVVAAKSAAEAEAIARRDKNIELENLDIEGVKEMAVLPSADWELDAIPYGQPEMNIAKWIEAGAAPKYVELRDRLQTAQDRVKSAGLLTQGTT